MKRSSAEVKELEWKELKAMNKQIELEDEQIKKDLEAILFDYEAYEREYEQAFKDDLDSKILSSKLWEGCDKMWAADQK